MVTVCLLKTYSGKYCHQVLCPSLQPFANYGKSLVYCKFKTVRKRLEGNKNILTLFLINEIPDDFNFLYIFLHRPNFYNVHAFILKPDVRGGETAQRQLRASSAFAEGALKSPVSMLGGLLLPQAPHRHLRSPADTPVQTYMHTPN